MTDPPGLTIPSTFAPSSTGGVTIEVVTAQLQCMDARLDTLTAKLYQMNTHASHISRRQACIGDFAASPSLAPSSEAFEDEDAIDGDDDDDKDEDASSSSDEEMTTSQ